jgi:hypothetical protein
MQHRQFLRAVLGQPVGIGCPTWPHHLADQPARAPQSAPPGEHAQIVCNADGDPIRTTTFSFIVYRGTPRVELTAMIQHERCELCAQAFTKAKRALWREALRLILPEAPQGLAHTQGDPR